MTSRSAKDGLQRVNINGKDVAAAFPQDRFPLALGQAFPAKPDVGKRGAATDDTFVLTLRGPGRGLGYCAHEDKGNTLCRRGKRRGFRWRCEIPMGAIRLARTPYEPSLLRVRTPIFAGSVSLTSTFAQTQ